METFQEKYSQEHIQAAIKQGREKSESEYSRNQQIRDVKQPFFAFALEGAEMLNKEQDLKGVELR